MIKVNVIVKDNAWRKYIKNPDIYLKNKLKKIQDDKFFSKNNVYVFSLLLSGSKEIKLLNKKFRKKNKTTDILSFPYQVNRDLLGKSIWEGSPLITILEFSPILVKNILI